MRRTALAIITASLFSLAACGGDDSSSPTGGSSGGTSGTGGTAGSGGGKAGGSGSGGSSGTGGTSGTGGSSGKGGASGGGGSGGTTGGAGGGGQAGKAGGDASTGTDARPDTPAGTDVAADGSTPGDATDGPAMDASSPPDGGAPDGTPPTDGSTGDGRSDAPTGDGGMTLTSTGFTEGAMILSDFTCAGTNVSPPLQWTPGPPGTLSYAVIFTDRSPPPLIHSIIYDIPASVTSLPMNVEKVANPTVPAGAKQVRGYDNSTYGYLGPCPNGALHNYEFSVRAIDVAALPGVMTTSTRAVVEPVINMHTLASGLLNGQSNAKK
jgi:Raf kinase inhibitor-like YbhB/YbcL family protein